MITTLGGWVMFGVTTIIVWGAFVGAVVLLRRWKTHQDIIDLVEQVEL